MEPIFALVLFAGGILEGLYASTVGCGSLLGISLLLFTGIPIHIAIGTNRFSVIFLESASTVNYHSKKKLLLFEGVIMGFIAAFGSIIGSLLVVNINEKILDVATVIILATVLIFISLSRNLGLKEKSSPKIYWPVIGPVIFLLGIYGGFLGAGFGTMITFIFLISGYSFLTGAANSRGVGLIMSIPSAIIFALNNSIHYEYGLSLGIGTAIGGWIGSGLGMGKGNVYIKVLFTIVVTASIIKLVLGI